MPMPRQRDHRAGKPTVQRARRERRHAARFDTAIERVVVEAEPLVVRAIARAVDVQQGHHEPRLVALATDTARGLDVLGARLGLAEHDHQA